MTWVQARRLQYYVKYAWVTVLGGPRVLVQQHEEFGRLLDGRRKDGRLLKSCVGVAKAKTLITQKDRSADCLLQGEGLLLDNTPMKVAILLSMELVCAVCHQARAFSAGVSHLSSKSLKLRVVEIGVEVEHANPSNIDRRSMRALLKNDDVEVEHANPSSIDRRSMLSGASAVIAAAASACVTSAPLSASAASTAGTSTSAVTPQELLARSRRVPCFAIVDKEGVPYVIVDKKTGFGTGYFFLTFSGALSVLGDAEKRAKEEGNEKVWEGARITTVPLDIALRLTLKKVERIGQNEIKRETISDILPGMDEREAASKLDKSGRFDEQGSVPVFYAEEGLEADDGSIPAYFSTATLVADWNRIYGEQKPLPNIKVVDLLDIFQGSMRGSAKLNPSFVPTEESIEVVKELQSRSLNVPYKADRMVMVGGKS